MRVFHHKSKVRLLREGNCKINFLILLVQIRSYNYGAVSISSSLPRVRMKVNEDALLCS